MNVDALIISYSAYNYLLSNTLLCKINGNKVDCASLGNNTLYVDLTKYQINSITLEITGVYNYIKQDSFVVRTVKKLVGASINGVTFSDVDIYYQ
jgi:hypothetical protein